MGEVTYLQAASGERVIAITGANGFGGRACVAEARQQGCRVVALYRSHPAPEWAKDAGIEPLQLDLTHPDAAQILRNALPANSALIHAATHLGDDPAALARDTITATRAVLDATQGRNVRVVLISSLAVYDTDAIAPGRSMTEASPLIPMPETAFEYPDRYLHKARDPYAGAKRLQDAMLIHAGCDNAWVLRPGVVWGPGRSWHALQGFWLSKLHVTIGSNGQLPLVHVDHMAQAAVQAARTGTKGVAVLNVFDDDLPTRARFLAAHKRYYGWPRFNITVPYGLWLRMIHLLKPVSGKLPGLFREPILRARMMPLRYPNTALRNAFRGEDIDTFEGMMARTRDAE